MDLDDDGWGFPAERGTGCAAGSAQGEGGEGGAAAVAPAFVRVTYSDDLALEICERLAAGESLRAICREARMPHPTTVREWRWRRPNFGEAMAAAMRAARYRRRRADLARAMRPRDARGLWSTYSHAIGAEICRRLVEGESLIAICRSEGMPCYSTVLNWARAVPEFGDAYALARRLATDHLFDEAREIALSVKPGTVWADALRFRILTWQVARASARKYVETMPEFEAQVRARTEARLADGWKDVLGLEPEEEG